MTGIIRVSDEVKSRLEQLKGNQTWEELMNDVIARLEELERINDYKTLYSEYSNYDLEHLNYQQGRSMPGLTKTRIKRMIEVIREWNSRKPIEEQIAPSISLLMDLRKELQRSNPAIKTITRGEYTQFKEEMEQYIQETGFDPNHNRKYGGLKNALNCFQYLANKEEG